MVRWRLSFFGCMAVCALAFGPAFAEPDLSGVWLPDVADQMRQERTNTPPWNDAAGKQVQHLKDEQKAGRPFLLLSHCLPHGMPSWMLITHNPFEMLVTPGRITMLGEVDGNRMRRIYTDGRSHSEDPDLTLHGESIGRWEGDTLVVDTVAILPQAFLAISEAVGIPNDGDTHVVERLHLTAPNTLHDDLEITAPHVLTSTWKTTRVFNRYPEKHFEIAEGECALGELRPGKDSYGNDIFVPAPEGEYGTVHTEK
ncbi:hypothetical protein MKK75_00620 [Methylobacterium sp. J-030]|uniref:hypothetical protein n=1 Tax=Methylobacterium sp. J-030 TaxID=2836627 RepID=UPI001FB8E75B|nr:hypothetical protein [Methylobacterium sp. J-030]MCJ2067324.1 hypothetical protein [Methylobacterium sp. J-030]